MNLAAPGIAIDAEIWAPDRHVLSQGSSAGLIRLEISTTVGEVRRLVSAYPTHYGPLLNPTSYGNLRGQRSASVSITLELREHEYRVQLKVPKSRFPDLLSHGPLNRGRHEPWIPCGPVIDNRGCDVKLSAALLAAGFNVRLWTSHVVALGLPVRPALLQPVGFLVQGQTWTLLANPNPTQPDSPHNL